MNRNEIALILLHARLINFKPSPSDITHLLVESSFNLADIFIQEAEKRNDIEEGS